MEAFGQHGVFALDFTRRARHHLFVLFQLFGEDLVGRRSHFELFHAFHLLAEVSELLGGAALLEGLFGVDHVLLAHRSLQLF